MRRFVLCLMVMSSVLVWCASGAFAGVITQINLSDFTTPSVLDFNSAPVGNISGTDSLFTNFGLSSISATGSNFVDAFGNRPNSSRALWFNSGGLAIVDPGVAGNVFSFNVGYTLNFQNAQNKFGFGVHDQSAAYTATFFSGATNVGSTSFAAGSLDLVQRYFQNTESFDRVQISGGGGIAIDNLTVDSTTSVIPEPSTWLLFGVGILSMFGIAYRRRKKAASE